MSQLDDYKYIVSLGPNKTSFYDPISKCNLFKTRKVFGFNIEPTTYILSALKSGTLVDVKGNLKLTDTIRTADPAVIAAEVNKQVSEQLAQIQGVGSIPQETLTPGVPPVPGQILPPLTPPISNANTDPNASGAGTPAGGEAPKPSGKGGSKNNKSDDTTTPAGDGK